MEELTKGLKPAQQQLEQDEFLKVELHSLEYLLKMVYDNSIKDAKTIIGLFWLKLSGLEI